MKTVGLTFEPVKGLPKESDGASKVKTQDYEKRTPEKRGVKSESDE